MNFLKTALMVLQLAISLIPSIVELVKAVEIPGYGPDKFKLVVGAIRDAFDILPDDIKSQIGLNKVEDFAGKLVNRIVEFLNATGVFQK